MSKELTPLEALNLLFELAYGHDTKPNSNYTWYAIIETTLKALEIILRKRVDVNCFLIYDLERYNNLVAKNDFMKITQEEYDLLVEVLTKLWRTLY